MDLFGAGDVETGGVEAVLELGHVVDVQQVVAAKLDAAVVHQRAVLEKVGGESGRGRRPAPCGRRVRRRWLNGNFLDNAQLYETMYNLMPNSLIT